MNALDAEIASLRRQRRSPGITASVMAWLRRRRPFDRRVIRNPAERDIYWARVQARLSESDHESLTRHRSTERPDRPEPMLIG